MIATRSSVSVMPERSFGWADVDDECEACRHHRLARRGVLPRGLGDVELHLPAVGALLLVHVDDRRAALERLADVRPALVLELLLAVQDHAPGAAELFDRQ